LSHFLSNTWSNYLLTSLLEGQDGQVSWQTRATQLNLCHRRKQKIDPEKIVFDSPFFGSPLPYLPLGRRLFLVYFFSPAATIRDCQMPLSDPVPSDPREFSRADGRMALCFTRTSPFELGDRPFSLTTTSPSPLVKEAEMRSSIPLVAILVLFLMDVSRLHSHVRSRVSCLSNAVNLE